MGYLFNTERATKWLSKWKPQEVIEKLPENVPLSIEDLRMRVNKTISDSQIRFKRENKFFKEQVLPILLEVGELEKIEERNGMNYYLRKATVIESSEAKVSEVSSEPLKIDCQNHSYNKESFRKLLRFVAIYVQYNSRALPKTDLDVLVKMVNLRKTDPGVSLYKELSEFSKELGITIVSEKIPGEGRKVQYLLQGEPVEVYGSLQDAYKKIYGESPEDLQDFIEGKITDLPYKKEQKVHQQPPVVKEEKKIPREKESTPKVITGGRLTERFNDKELLWDLWRVLNALWKNRGIKLQGWCLVSDIKKGLPLETTDICFLLKGVQGLYKGLRVEGEKIFITQKDFLEYQKSFSLKELQEEITLRVRLPLSTLKTMNFNNVEIISAISPQDNIYRISYDRSLSELQSLLVLGRLSQVGIVDLLENFSWGSWYIRGALKEELRRQNVLIEKSL